MAWVVTATTEAQRPVAFGYFAVTIASTMLLGQALGGILYSFGGFQFVNCVAGGFALFSCIVILKAKEPTPPVGDDEKSNFQWSDVWRVLNSFEWLYLAVTYLVVGTLFGLYMIFSSIVLADRWGFQPWQISAVSWPNGVSSIICNVIISPRLIKSQGPKFVVRYATLMAVILAVCKVNWWDATFEWNSYLARTLICWTLFQFPVSLVLPTLSLLIPRAILMHGSPHIIGTVTGLTRVFMTIGMGIGPFVGSVVYTTDPMPVEIGLNLAIIHVYFRKYTSVCIFAIA
jgi:predicted MFS family arabinose efflux permease